MPNRPALMLFAAGRGTRMAPLTERVPKPMISVAGKSLIDHALGVARDAGIARIVVNTHHLSDQIAAHLAGSDVVILHEAELLETGGGLRNALPVLGEAPVLTMNSDAVWSGGNPVSDLLAAWRPDDMDALLALVPPDAALGHTGAGDFDLDAAGRLRRAKGLVYTGVQILKTDRLHEIDERVFSLNRVWDLMAAEGRLFGHVFQGGWCDVGRPENIAMAEAMLGV